MKQRVDFRLEKMPEWILFDDRVCRACGVRTSHVLTAIGQDHTFPSCADIECQEVVKGKILESLQGSRISA